MASLLTEHRRVSRKRGNGTSFHFSAGTKIFDPQHPCRRAYLLTSGRVRLFRGPGAIVEQLGANSFFGEVCFLSPRRSDQIATTLSSAAATGYRRSELLRRLQQDPRFAALLVKNLALRIDRCQEAIRGFVTEGAERRLARLLSRLAPSRRTSGWVRLPFRMTNVELAKMVGTTRWRVSHFLNHFQRLGWLSRQQDQLWIRREGLSEFLTGEKPTNEQ